MFNQEKSLEGNRAYRRKIKKLESTSSSRKLKSIADKQADVTAKQRAAKVEKRIDNVKARKLERLAVEGSKGKEISAKYNKKLSAAEQKQLKKRIKRLNFKAKIKSIIG